MNCKNIKHVVLAVSVAAAAQFSMAAHAAQNLALFGVALKGATRQELRPVLLKAGLTPIRVSDQYFCDTYTVHGQLHGASELDVCYREDDNHFAEATYKFPAFMDTTLVRKVVSTVESKYGRPGSFNGSYDLGPVHAAWAQPQGMRIQVSRGWPDTTVYLSLEDRANDAAMHAQMHRDQSQRQQQQAAHDSNAF